MLTNNIVSFEQPGPGHLLKHPIGGDGLYKFRASDHILNTYSVYGMW